MAVFRRLAAAFRLRRTIAPPKTLTPFRPLHPRNISHRIHGNASRLLWPAMLVDASGQSSLYPAIVAGLFAFGTLGIAHADATEAAGKPYVSSDSPSSYPELEAIAKTERKRIEEILRSKGMQYGSYPRFTVAVKGQNVTIKFQVPPACEVSQLIANLASNLGLKSDEQGGGSEMLLRAWDSTVAWQLTLKSQGKHKEKTEDDKHLTAVESDLCILIFKSLISSDRAEVEFIKKGSLNALEIEAFVSVLQLAGKKLGQTRISEKRPRGGAAQMPQSEKLIASLEGMGVRIYGLNEPHKGSSGSEIVWDNIAGYDHQKREIEDTILLALKSPEVYDDIARGTRCKFESNRPRAVLFEGPPGTGKTSCARVIANQAGVPLLYVPLEVVVSKYYGESERLLGQVFSLANELSDGALIFLDEVDAFAAARDSEMHEATRRMLSVLLRQIDGFEQEKRVIVIAATNRKQDLDPALISRFDSIITFGLPNQQTRQEIAAQYAKHLTRSELHEFAKVTKEMSGRDIRDVCQQAERQWASKVIRGVVPKDGEQRSLPPLEEYIESALNRKKALLSYEEKADRNLSVGKKLDFCSLN